MIGTKLAHYEITAHLGSGGMGDVYQASDTRLGRSVAIKMLPAAFAADADRAARFEREARVLASLNHPHIAAIHGLEDAGGHRFLVMELVEGDTLAERIAHGALPIEDALRCARQIAEALETAHEKGIVHRDLKPANVKLTPEGQVKVLDFGLAKALSDEGVEPRSGTGPAGLTNSPTLSLGATHAGVILGTAAYMSPEQAKGQAVDRRTDLFAFGCVLFEMLAGEPAFGGDSVPEILANVIKSEPSWLRLPADTPTAIHRLLRRCLRKDRNLRLQSAGDARIEIDEAAQEPEPSGAAGVAPVPRVRAREWIAWSAAVASAAAAVVAVALMYFRAVPDMPAVRLDIATPQTLEPISFAIAPDGRRLTFVATQDGESRLWLRPLDAVTAQPLMGTDGATFPFWSPDSRSIGFFAGGKLKRLDIGGGLPQTIADAPSARGGTWMADGGVVFSPNTGGPLLRVSASGGQPVMLTTLEAPQQSHRFPQALPDGRHLLFFIQAAGAQSDVQGIYLSSIDGSHLKRLTPAETAGAYTSGWLLYVREGTLVSQRLDLSAETVSGDTITVADPVGVDTSLNIAAFSVSSAGTLVYRGSGYSRRQLTWFDRIGKPLGTLNAPDENVLLDPDLSPDGRRAVVDRKVQNNTDLWLLDGNRATRFTFDPAIDHWPVWSHDGKWIAFDSTRRGSHDLFIKPSNGETDEQLILESPEGKGAMDWSPDGRYLLYASLARATAFDLWVLPLEDRKPRVFLQTRFDETMGQFSPDGRWIAYQSNESGQYQVYVRPFPGPGGQWQVSTGGGTQPRWRRDGRELYYIATDNKLMAVLIETRGSIIEPGAPIALFQPRTVGGSLNSFAAKTQYAVAADGRFLINITPEAVGIDPLTVVLNWKPEGK